MAGSYDFEEQERLAELKAWWEDNRVFVFIVAGVAIAALVGWEGWKVWKERQAEDAATLYRPVAAAAKANDAKKVADTGKALVERQPRSFYASDAALLMAKNAFDAGDFAEARKQLAWVADKGVEELRPVARLRLAAVSLDEKKYDDALKALDAVKEDAFAAAVADLRGDVMLAQGRLDEARANYKAAADKAGPRNPLKSVVDTKLAALGGGQ